MQMNANRLRRRYVEVLHSLYGVLVLDGTASTEAEMTRQLEGVTSRPAYARTVVLSGLSGVGKSTIGARLSEHHGFNKIRNTYTRPRRALETDHDGVFVSEATFETLRSKNAFLTVNETNGSLHGLSYDELRRCTDGGRSWMDKSVTSMEKLEGHIEADLFYVLPESFDMLLTRLLGREAADTRTGMGPSELFDRLEEEIDELAASGSLPYRYLMNDSLDRVEAIIALNMN